jgi:hypothetical protein
MTVIRDFRPTRRGGPGGQRGRMNTLPRRIRRQMSVSLTALAASAFAAGVVIGLIEYLDRSPVREKFVPGTSAWWPHLGVAVVACGLLALGQWRHRRRFGRGSGRLWLLAPLGQSAARRVARTCSAAPGRAAAALLPAALFLYGFWRAGKQVIGGLDPNATVNAWGGPTYVGAMACHYLDLLVVMALAAWLIDKLLSPDPRAGAGSVTAAGRPRSAAGNRS